MLSTENIIICMGLAVWPPLPREFAEFFFFFVGLLAATVTRDENDVIYNLTDVDEKFRNGRYNNIAGKRKNRQKLQQRKKKTTDSGFFSLYISICLVFRYGIMRGRAFAFNEANRN